MLTRAEVEFTSGISSDDEPRDLSPGEPAPTLTFVDRAEFVGIYQQHHHAVYFTACLTCGSDLAADVTQETFFRLWNRPDRFDSSRGSLRTLLLTMSHHIAVDMIRSQAARWQREKRDDFWTIADDDDDGVGERLLRGDEVDRVRQALITLSPVERQAIVTVFYGECSYRQAAKVLDIPEGTIKSRIRSALHHLRTLLDDPAAAVAGRNGNPVSIHDPDVGDKASIHDDQVQFPLDSRIAVEQAKGMIAESCGVDLVEAFSRLQAIAGATNRPLTEAAEAVVSGTVAIEAFQSATRPSPQPDP